MRFLECYGKLIPHTSNNYSFVEILRNFYYHAESRQYIACYCAADLPIFPEILTLLGYRWFGLIVLPEIRRENSAWQSASFDHCTVVANEKG